MTGASSEHAAGLSTLVVLYEDNHLLAVFKPAGERVQGDATGEPSLLDRVRAWLVQKYEKPGNAFVGLVHRLDRPVAGIVVFAKTSKAAARLSAQIRERTVEKTYRALVEGDRATGATLENFVSSEDGFVKVHDAPGPGRQSARLAFRVVRRAGDRTELEIDLETGRKHQIRAQLAHLGHPIVGDARYGARTRWQADAIALVSARMRFRHPTRPEDVSVELPSVLDPLR